MCGVAGRSDLGRDRINRPQCRDRRRTLAAICRAALYVGRCAGAEEEEQGQLRAMVCHDQEPCHHDVNHTGLRRAAMKHVMSKAPLALYKNEEPWQSTASVRSTIRMSWQDAVVAQPGPTLVTHGLLEKVGAKWTWGQCGNRQVVMMATGSNMEVAKW